MRMIHSFPKVWHGNCGRNGPNQEIKICFFFVVKRWEKVQQVVHRCIGCTIVNLRTGAELNTCMLDLSSAACWRLSLSLRYKLPWHICHHHPFRTFQQIRRLWYSTVIRSHLKKSSKLDHPVSSHKKCQHNLVELKLSSECDPWVR